MHIFKNCAYPPPQLPGTPQISTGHNIKLTRSLQFLLMTLFSVGSNYTHSNCSLIIRNYKVKNPTCTSTVKTTTELSTPSIRNTPVSASIHQPRLLLSPSSLPSSLPDLPGWSVSKACSSAEAGPWPHLRRRSRWSRVLSGYVHPERWMMMFAA